uniref:CUE domain containing 1a n=1 Tax=Astyanax mexicanus TaxID=7994 RepID=A0A8B9GVV3_ASTMX
MTSLFRRSASSSGSHGSSSRGAGGTGAPPELNNSKAPRQVRRLEFNQAMDDFKTMFPSMEHEVIECVLRSNNGAVDSTIDQLLQMSLEGQGTDDSSDSDDSIPPEVLERTLEPDSSDEEPPPVYSPPSYDMHIYDRKHPADLGLWGFDVTFKNSIYSLSQPSSSSSSLSSLTQYSSASGSGAALGVSGWASEQDRKLKQYLEDEHIALFLQNEEFMRELQRNRDFLIALERDRQRFESLKPHGYHSSACMERCSEGDHCASGAEEACTPVSDDALFRDKLKHMGKCKEYSMQSHTHKHTHVFTRAVNPCSSPAIVPRCSHN